MVKAGRYDDLGINKSVLKNIELTNMLYSTTVGLSTFTNTSYLSSVTEGLHALTNAGHLSVVDGLNTLAYAGHFNLVEGLRVRLVESLNIPFVPIGEVANLQYTQHLINGLSAPEELIRDAIIKMQPIMDNKFDTNSAISYIASSLITLIDFDYDNIRNEMSIDDLDLEYSDIESINDVCETIQSEIDNNKLTFESLLEILYDKYLEFKDTKPYTAKTIKYLASAILIPLTLTIVGGVVVAKLLADPNDKSVYQEIQYNTNKNYYIEVESVPYYTEVEIYDKYTDELLNSGYISKVKLNEIDNLQEQTKNTGLEE